MEHKLYFYTAKTKIMDLQARKYAFIRALFKVESDNVMDELESILRKKQIDQGIDIVQYNKDIDKSLKEIEEGKVYTHEEVKECIKQWAKR